MTPVARRWIVVVPWVILAALAPIRPTRAAGSINVESEFRLALEEFDEAQRIRADDADRSRKMFLSAAQRFSSIMAAGVVNGRIEYNLGNCYLQAGDVGRAILHYRRAQRDIPRDPLLADNLKVARSRRLTAIEPTSRGALIQSLFSWHWRISARGKSQVAIVLYALFWLGLTVRVFYNRRFVTVAALTCASCAAILGCSVMVARWSDRNAPEGVVTAMDVVVYKGPGSEYQRRFEQPLQPGLEYTLRERRGEWRNVELPDGQTGWIRAAQSELIPRRDS